MAVSTPKDISFRNTWPTSKKSQFNIFMCPNIFYIILPCSPLSMIYFVTLVGAEIVHVNLLHVDEVSNQPALTQFYWNTLRKAHNASDLLII